MRLAVVGSRSIKTFDPQEHMPDGVTELVSGGAEGVDTAVAAYAQRCGIALTVFLPQYDRFGRAAPLRRNDEIVEYADEVLVIWDGHSPGSRYVTQRCRKQGKPCRVVIVPQT